jgi:hypothetical protein
MVRNTFVVLQRQKRRGIHHKKLYSYKKIAEYSLECTPNQLPQSADFMMATAWHCCRNHT